MKGGVLQAVSNVSFDLHAGETLGIVGETGSGKSTLARSVIQAPPPKRGQVIFEGQDLVGLPNRAMKSVRRDMQMVFQDPFRSLDPKWTVSRIVTEPLIAYGIGSRAEPPQLRALADGRLVACHFPLSQVATSKATAGQAAAGDGGD